MEDTLAIIRIAAYAATAVYCAFHRRWWAWGTLTALTFSTYAYHFYGLSALAVELVRTAVGAALIYTVIRRR